jgi:phenylacetate-CoA ligase
MTALNMHSNIFDNVKQFQFYQDTKGILLLNIVGNYSYTNADTIYIKKELYKKLGNDIELLIKFVDDIPLTQSGKHRFLIQKLPIAFSD